MKTSTDPRVDYVQRVLGFYLTLAITPARASRLDLELAEAFYDRRIKLEQIEAAMIVASARRLLRDPKAPKLGPIRSLHYFVPVIEEIEGLRLPPNYVEFLRGKLEKVKWIK